MTKITRDVISDLRPVILRLPSEVRYHDLFAAEFARRGVAYFSYNTRFTEVDENSPPTFDRVDPARFRAITPAERTQDLETIVRHLRKDSRLSRCRVLLLGWSEGSIIARNQVPEYVGAPQINQSFSVKPHALFGR